MNLLPRNDSFFPTDFFQDPFAKMQQFMKADIYEKEDHYVLEMDLPGYEKSEITVNYDEGYLTIMAHREHTSEEKGQLIRKERCCGEVRREFYVGNIEEEQIHAKYKDGMLKIEFPKETESKKTRRNIDID